MSPEFPIIIKSASELVEIELIRYVYDGGNPNSPLAHAIQIRSGLPKRSPAYSRPPKLENYWETRTDQLISHHSYS